MEIRETKIEDLKELAFLYKQNYYGESDVITNEKGMIKQFKKLKKNKNYIFISAVENQKLIGFCQGVLNYEIIENQQPVLTIWNMRILPEYRRQGVGKNIMDMAEKFAKKNNAIGIFVGCDFENIIAQNFYKKLNYKEDFGYFKHL